MAEKCWLRDGCPSRTGACSSCQPTDNGCSVYRWFENLFINNPTKIEKKQPIAKIMESYGEDGRGPRSVNIGYYCPTCGRYIGSWKKETACDKCGTFYYWGNKEPKIKTMESIEWD